MDEVRDAIAARVNPSGRPAALTFNAHITGLAVARSLGARGVPVVALDRHPAGVGLYARDAAVSALCPNPTEDDEGFVSYLLEVGEALDERAVLFPTNDEWVMAVSRHRERLEQRYILPFSPLPVVEPILNKARLHEQAERLGIPSPRTWYLAERPAREVADELEFPCIIKPAEQRLFFDRWGEKLWVANDRAEFLRLADEAHAFELLAQELIPPSPDGFYSLCSYSARDGRAAGLFVGAKLAQYPHFSGTACLVEARWAPEIAERGGRILRAFGYHGIAETEFMRDPRDGEYKLIDLNTRVWKWIGLPIACGVDLPWLAYADALGIEIAEARPSVDGVRWTHARDLFALARERGAGAGELLSDQEWELLLGGDSTEGSPRLVDAVYSPSDPAPFARLLRNELTPRSRYYCAC